jgi:alpha-L-fucosidase
MFVHANIATVPAFAPLHEYADWYWGFLETKPDIVLHPTCPMPEIVAWHREHFGDQPFDAFIPELTFERFDANAYAQLLDDAGMRYLVHVTKHHDGFCWWDASHTDRNSVVLGPKRDVVRELADAVRARGHVFGCYYSLLDWSHADYPDPERYVDAFMRPQIQELVERYEPALLWGDGHWGHPGGHWRADRIFEDARAYAAAHGFEIALNDRFFASAPDFVTFEYDVPASPPSDRLWEVCRGLGSSFCVNRNERVDEFLTAAEIVAMLVETVAKGGNLLLNVGPNADGTIPDIQASLLRDSGAWVREHADAIHGSTAFDVPGRGKHWYTRTGDVVNAFDLSSAPEPCFEGLVGVTGVTTAAGVALDFRAADGGLTIDARPSDRHPYGTRYCLRFAPDARPVRVADHSAPRRTLGALLAGAATGAGAVVDVPAGRYDHEEFPLVVPAGVTLRGAGAARVTIDAGGNLAVVLGGEGATLEGVTVVGGSPGYMMIPPTCVTGQGADRLTVRDCVVESIAMVGGAGHVVTGNVIAGGKVWLMGTSGSEIRANYQHGLRWGAGIEVQGGAGHVIAQNECRDDLCAIKCVETVGARVERNRYETRWFGIHLLNATGSVLYRNRAWRTMRAVTVEGGADNRVEKQLAEHCDSGAVVEGGATGTVVTNSWFHDCRVGVIVWGVRDVELLDNAISEPRDHAIVTDLEGLTFTDQRADAARGSAGDDVWIHPT